MKNFTLDIEDLEEKITILYNKYGADCLTITPNSTEEGKAARRVYNKLRELLEESYEHKILRELYK